MSSLLSLTVGNIAVNAARQGNLENKAELVEADLGQTLCTRFKPGEASEVTSSATFLGPVV